VPCFKLGLRCPISAAWRCRVYLKSLPIVFLCTRASFAAACTNVRLSLSGLSGDSDPAAAAALSLAVEDVAMLADSSFDVIDRAKTTSVSIDDKWVLLFMFACLGGMIFSI
jgi:hypothetical protein